MTNRYNVILTAYSLASGRVGEPIAETNISSHRSLAAAGRVLGSLISGKRTADAKAFARQFPGCGLRYVAIDRQTGAEYARNACKARA